MAAGVAQVMAHVALLTTWLNAAALLVAKLLPVVGV
jgi:hypothetical protein